MNLTFILVILVSILEVFTLFIKLTHSFPTFLFEIILLLNILLQITVVIFIIKGCYKVEP